LGNFWVLAEAADNCICVPLWVDAIGEELSDGGLAEVGIIQRIIGVLRLMIFVKEIIEEGILEAHLLFGNLCNYMAICLKINKPMLQLSEQILRLL
jgi:hypothetical protein